jgi:hypothetical protein
MTLPLQVLEGLAAFKAKLPTVVKKKRVRMAKRPQHEPTVVPEPKPAAPTPNVRRNGPKSWLVMLPTAAATRGLKTREDPVFKDAPITSPPYNVSHMTGNTARICNDAQLFKRTRK